MSYNHETDTIGMFEFFVKYLQRACLGYDVIFGNLLSEIHRISSCPFVSEFEQKYTEMFRIKQPEKRKYKIRKHTRNGFSICDVISGNSRLMNIQIYMIYKWKSMHKH